MDLQMLRRLTKFQSSQVFTLDGEVGKVRDVYFDDVTWVVRYLVVDTGGWLPGWKVMISPQSVELIDAALGTVSLSLTHARIEASPGIDSNKPLSPQCESEFNRYYGIPPYWTQSRVWSPGPLPPVFIRLGWMTLGMDE
jgi:PRC-barrel domain